MFEEMIELHQQYLLIGALGSLGGEFPGLVCDVNSSVRHVEDQAKLPTFGVP